ncbi:poly-gamma-glutamate synthase PgsB [Tsukamurella serpentis]
MIVLYALLVGACLVLLGCGVLEQRRHHQNLHSIPVRVVINGIRGKSSITRLCAGALRGGDLVTVAKTTGTAARFIPPDGTDEQIHRRFGLANVIEQVGIVRRAASFRPDALVIECMAVLPDLQEINERKLIHSTICVICNVREDHVAEMGPTLEDIARSLSRSMPKGGVCVTAEKEHVHVLREEARKRDCRLIEVDPDDISDEIVAGFPFITFKENIAIAFAVAQMCGVDRDAALKGMVESAADPGTVAVSRYRSGDKRIAMANIFAANDPESTRMNIDLLTDRGLIGRPLNVIINCRPDRVERNGQMGELTGVLDPDRIILIGDPTRSAKVSIPDTLTDRVSDLGGRLDFESVLSAVVADETGAASVVTIGNIHGSGEVLLHEFNGLDPDTQETSC